MHSFSLVKNKTTNKIISPAQCYNKAVEEGRVDYDISQQQAVSELDRLFAEITALPAKHIANQGVYLWGEVGRGKTFLMDLFCQSLPEGLAWRMHFHRFMAWVHQRLQHYAGRKNPLILVAKDIAKKHRLLCFDELFVKDIGDAMLLGTLFENLFKLNVTLVATSNIEALQLYRDGLQRDRFLPAIKAIIKHTVSLHLDGDKDHRQRSLQHAPIYFEELPLSLLQKLELPQPVDSQHNIEILGRTIATKGTSKRSLHCSFEQLCEGTRSHLDYIQLAQRYTDVVLTEIPPLSGQSYERIKARGTEEATLTATSTGAREVKLGKKDDAVRRFISLVDEFYERKVNLYLVSETPLESLYTEGSLTFEFQRTQSRLTEMASHEYLQLAHQP
ncbi:MAG: cell division protein ZapE [Pseudomonadales bacterium]